MADPQHPTDMTQEEGGSELKRLSSALALAEGFQLCVLICPTPRIAAAAVAMLQHNLNRLTGLRVRFVQLNPYDTLQTHVTFEALADALLPTLVGQGASTGERNALFVLDATRANLSDEAAWVSFFRRLNELRNVVVRRLPGQLLLCMPRNLAKLFAHEAPDFWSIRTAEVVLEENPLFPSAHESRSTSKIDFVPLEFGRQVSSPHAPASSYPDLVREADRARQRVAAAPGDFQALQALFILLMRLGNFQMDEAGNSGAAELIFRSALDQVSRMQVLRGDIPAVVNNLAACLDRIGDIHLERRELDRASEMYQQSMDLTRSLVERQPDQVEWQFNLSVSLERLGALYQQQGHYSEAADAHRQSAEIRRKLLRTDPRSAEFLYSLSVSLDGLGSACRDLGDLDGADAAYRESEQIRSVLVDRYPAQPQWLRDLAVAKGHLGRLCFLRDDLDSARDHYEHAIEILERLLEGDSNNPTLMRDLLVSHGSLGEVYRVRGDLKRASLEYDAALRLARSLVQRNRQQPDSRHDLAVTLHQAALGSLEAQDDSGAERSLTEAISLIAALREREPENPIFLADLCEFLCDRSKLALRRGDQEGAIGPLRDAALVIDGVPAARRSTALQRLSERCREQMERVKTHADIMAEEPPRAS